MSWVTADSLTDIQKKQFLDYIKTKEIALLSILFSE